MSLVWWSSESEGRRQGTNPRDRPVTATCPRSESRRGTDARPSLSICSDHDHPSTPLHPGSCRDLLRFKPQPHPRSQHPATASQPSILPRICLLLLPPWLQIESVSPRPPPGGASS
ncbi:hypothetical protein SORBI_3006G090201 [Sorghum bicolor]|uniref:Uncharacterized protein n=1 Tax=Sorghum bicolor TaxID=4558 RepID=A0A1Z5RDR5_SORBI|nr:hypothetical protein SORBI_3006G090201 [Sorghum bicolor]